MSSTKWYNIENLSLIRREDVLYTNGNFITKDYLGGNSFYEG